MGRVAMEVDARQVVPLSNLILGDADPDVLLLWQLSGEDAVAKARSEERRVGKEC